jgi:D-alanyl-D-alanine carboxypeptidase
MKKISFWQVAIFFIIFAANVSFISAQVSEAPIAQTKASFVQLDKKTIAKGYTVVAFDDAIKLSLIPGILDEATGVDVLELHEPLVEPWQLDRVSEAYQFEFRNKAAYDNTKPFIIQLAYDSDDTNLKQVYYFDKNYGSWQPLPTKDYTPEHMVRAYIHLPFARVAVFSNPNVMGTGQASWYAHKGGDFAASPDFPKGALVRVTNLANSKSVDVEINDWGPDRSLHPERAIDLDKVAFQKIASLSDGVISVSLEPLTVSETSGRVLGIKLDNTVAEPEVLSKAAVVMDVASSTILYAKNATSTMPLASLTKIITASVFLDTNPDFEKIIAYQTADEEKNWEYVDKSESARLRVADGDVMSVADVFFTTLMASTNNTAETLVRISGLSRDEFIARMNEKVAFWGASDTHFVEPTGLSPQNVSSVLDYAIITAHAFANPKLLETTTKETYEFVTRRDNVKKTIRNTNDLLYSDFYVTGGKTGYLDEAGYCLMEKIKTDDGRELIGVIFGADTRARSFDELSDLLKYVIRKKL